MDQAKEQDLACCVNALDALRIDDEHIKLKAEVEEDTCIRHC